MWGSKDQKENQGLVGHREKWVLKAPKVSQDLPAQTLPFRVRKAPRDHKVLPGQQERLPRFQAHKDQRDPRENKDPRGCKGHRERRGFRGSRDYRVHKALRETQVPLAQRETRAIRGLREHKEHRGTREFRDPRASKVSKENLAPTGGHT